MKSKPEKTLEDRLLTKHGLPTYTLKEHLAKIESVYELTDAQRLIVIAMIRGTGPITARTPLAEQP